MSEWAAISGLKNRLAEKIIGQETLLDRLLIALIADGHLLVEGAPGLAKTKAIKYLASEIEGDFHRIQFTPDLLPADVTGTEIYRPQEATFQFQKGPIFHNLVLADEINRAPAKVQSALLEAMAERQISVGKTTHTLPKLFMVMATQNPIEQEGTYPLPEAQLDRFLMHVRIDYPSAETEKKILHLSRREALSVGKRSQESKEAAETEIVTESQIMRARTEALNVHMTPAIEEYIIQLVMATRTPGDYDDKLADAIEFGVSPRGTIAIDRCARAHAWLYERDYVTPEDVQQILPDVLRHRIGLTFEAEASGSSPDTIIENVLAVVPAP